MTSTPDRRLRLRPLNDLLADADGALRAGYSASAQVWPTGFGALDEALTGGLRSGELVLLAGAHGDGKTTLGLQMIRNVIADGGIGLVFSYEHDGATLLHRLLALEAAEAIGHRAAQVHQVRRALEAGSGGRSLEELLSTLPGGSEAYAALTAYQDRLLVHESSGSGTTLTEIAKTIHGVRQSTGVAPVVLVDYLQKVPIADVADDDARISSVADGLKDLALDCAAPIIAIAAADKESLVAGHRMRTHDLRGSATLAYEADLVFILSDKASIVSREHLVYDLTSADRFRRYGVVSVEKNRHGRGGVVLEFLKDFEHGRFDRAGGAVTERLIDERIVVS